MRFFYLELDLQVEAMAVHETSTDNGIDDDNKYSTYEELPCLLLSSRELSLLSCKSIVMEQNTCRVRVGVRHLKK
jgi:hypothetical protein